MAPPKRCFEVCILVAAMVASAGAFIGALFTEIKFRELDNSERDMIKMHSESEALDQNELLLKTQVTAGLVFATTGLLGIFGIIALVGRICNVKHETSNRRIFTCLYLLFVLLCFCGFAAAGVLGVFTSMDWSDIVSLQNVTGSFETELENLRNSIAATSACSLLAVLLFLLLQVVVLFCCAANRDY